MIDIIQWRASIGGFNISVQSVRNTCIDNNIRCDNIRCDSLEFIEYEVPSTCHYFPIVWFLSVYYVLNIFFQICLILSGDIETNPGPISYKTCPSCDAQIPIRKKICLCGYAFSQKYQNLKTINQFPTCASPSISHTGTLDPDKSIKLDDTGLLNVSCRTLTKKTLEGENERVSNEAVWETERVDIVIEGENERVDNETEGESERVDIETKGENERVDTQTEGENERVDNESMKLSFNVGMGSLSQPSEGSIKWGKRSEAVNAKRRLQYKLNPISKRLINQRYY